MQESKNLNTDNEKNYFIKLMNIKIKGFEDFFWIYKRKGEKFLKGFKIFGKGFSRTELL